MTLKKESSLHTVWSSKDDGGRHGSIASVVTCLDLEIVCGLRRQFSYGRRQSIASDIMSHPIAITIRRIRRVEHLITYVQHINLNYRVKSKIIGSVNRRFVFLGLRLKLYVFG